MADRYLEGATVYQLATEFAISRCTVSERLKQQGVTLRRQSPSIAAIDDMVRLYESGLSSAAIAVRNRFATRTVQRCLHDRAVQAKDSHGAERL